MQLEFGGRRYAVAAADVIIGSAPDSTLLLPAPGVLPRHAVVRLLGDGMAVVLPASPEAEILVNGTRLGGDPTPLMHGDKVGIGGLEITVADPRRAGATRVLSAVASEPRSNPSRTPAAAPGNSAGRLVSLSDGREYPLQGSVLVIGREAGCGVVVDGDAVSRRHAEIVRAGQADWLTDVSGNGTLVNGERLRGKTLLKSGDVIQVGTVELRYYAERAREAPMPAAPVAAPALAALLVKSGQLAGERLTVRTPVVNIGRAEYNDIRLPDQSVSASHAKLQLRDGVWMLSDLGSTNGSKVDGEPVTGELPLSPGTVITLGEVRLFFEPHDAGPRRAAGTAVFQAPALLPDQAAAVSTAARRRPPELPTASLGRRILLVGTVLLGALLLVGYFFLR